MSRRKWPSDYTPQTKAEKQTLKMYHTEALRKVLMYDEPLSERQMVLRGNKALIKTRKIRFTHAILDDAIYEMLEANEIEGNCIDGWTLVGMDTDDAKEGEYRGLVQHRLHDSGMSSGAQHCLRNLQDHIGHNGIHGGTFVWERW